MQELLIAFAIVAVAAFAAWKYAASYPLYGSDWTRDIQKRRRALKRLQRLSEKMGLYDTGDKQ